MLFDLGELSLKETLLILNKFEVKFKWITFLELHLLHGNFVFTLRKFGLIATLKSKDLWNDSLDVSVWVILIQKLLGLFITIKVWLGLLCQELLMLRVYDLTNIKNPFQELSEW
jgi:hypothetical protein